MQQLVEPESSEPEIEPAELQALIDFFMLLDTWAHEEDSQ